MIAIVNMQRQVRIPRKMLTEIATKIMRGEKKSGDVSFVFVDNTEIHRLNRQYLNHDWDTDVISFLLRDDTNPGDQTLGEVVISAQKAAQEARRRSIATRTELLLYAVHGLLHLCGYDDGKPADIARMRAREIHYMKKILPNYRPL